MRAQSDPFAEPCRLCECAAVCRAAGELGDAAELLGQALALVLRHRSTAGPAIASVVGQLAAVRMDLGDFREAARLYRRSLRILKERAGDGDEDLCRLRVQCLCGLAGACRAQGLCSMAESLLRDAAQRVRAGRDPALLDLVAVLNEQGLLCKHRGELARAGRAYRRALSILIKALGPDHPRLATLYHNLGGIEHARGRHSHGEPFARRAVELRERALGPDHPGVAADVAALAALLDGRGEREEAERLYRRALAIFERTHGADSYEVAVNLNNLAALCQETGRTGEAEAQYRRSLAIKERVLGKGHLDVATGLNNLASLYQDMGRHALAEALYARALVLFRRKLGPTHRKVVICRENRSKLLRQMGRRGGGPKPASPGPEVHSSAATSRRAT